MNKWLDRCKIFERERQVGSKIQGTFINFEHALALCKAVGLDDQAIRFVIGGDQVRTDSGEEVHGTPEEMDKEDEEVEKEQNAEEEETEDEEEEEEEEQEQEAAEVRKQADENEEDEKDEEDKEEEEEEEEETEEQEGEEPGRRNGFLFQASSASQLRRISPHFSDVSQESSYWDRRSLESLFPGVG